MKMNRLATLVAATIMLNASLMFADDSLFITLPGETYVETAGNAGTPSKQTVGTAFAVKIRALTDTVNFATDTSFSGVVAITYSGPSGGITYVANVTFVSGLATNNLTITNAQTTTISVTAAGAMTPIASSSLQVNPKLIVTLPGQTFTSGTGNSGTVSTQTAGVPFNITSLTAINGDNTIDTAFAGDETVSYSGPANAPIGGGTPSYTTSVNFASGVSTTPLATTLVAAQTTTITASISGATTSVASSSLTVGAGAAAQIAFALQTTGGPPGVAWKYQPTVALQDAYGNGPVTNFAQNVTLAIQNNPSSGTLSGTATVAININTGIATFSGLSIDNVGNGYTLTATGDTLDTSPGTVVSALFNIIALTAYDTAVLNDNPIAYWPLQETSGTTIFDVAGTNTGTTYLATDAAGGSDSHVTFNVDNSGFVMGDAGLLNTNFYPGDKSIYFSTNFNDAKSEIACGYATNWDTPQYSGEVWLRIPNFPLGYVGDTTTNNMNDIAVFGPTGGGGNSTQSGYLFDLQIDHNNNVTNVNTTMGRVDAWIGKGSGWAVINGLTNSSGATNSYGYNTYYSGQVIYVAQTYDGTTLKYYVNGVLVGSTGSTHNRISQHGSDKWPFVMGSYQQDYFTASTPVGAGGKRSRFYTGGMAHGATYNYALTAAQILNHYTLGTVGPGSPPIIGTQPIGGTNYIGYSRTISVAASGTAPLRYQWYKGAAPIANKTNDTLVLSNLQLSDAADYSVTITNSLAGTNSTIATVGVLPLPSDAYQSNIISAFPQAFYTLHETNGPVAYDMIDPVDNNGTYVTYDPANYPIIFGTNGASSHLGTAVAFNPLGTNGIYINNLATMPIVGQLTLEAWMQVQDTNDEQPIIVQGPAIQGNPSQTANRLEINGGNYVFERFQQTATPQDFGASYAIPPADHGSWVYLVGVADGTNWNLYENGVLVASTPDTNSPSGAVSANGGWAIGARPSNPGVESPIVVAGSPTGTTLNGSINNVAIYNYALSPAIIQQHYQIGLTGISGPPTMSISRFGSNVIVSWTAGYLQEASSVTGPWTYDNTNSVISPYTVGATNSAIFYRATLTPP